jgi:hypothetical protein
MPGDEETDDGEIEKEPEQKEKEDSPDKKKAEHEAAEAKRKEEWEKKHAEKKAAFDKALQELLAMSDDDVMGKSVKRAGDDLERLIRHNLKMCVTEHIQTLCLDNPAFARLVCHPGKSMINCFKYIFEKAKKYVEDELEIQGKKPEGSGYGDDVPDGLCYQWAEDYFNDPDAEVDRDKDDKFVPKPFYGGSSSKTKTKKKETPKKAETAEKDSKNYNEQIDIFGGDAS